MLDYDSVLRRVVLKLMHDSYDCYFYDIIVENRLTYRWCLLCLCAHGMICCMRRCVSCLVDLCRLLDTCTLWTWTSWLSRIMHLCLVCVCMNVEWKSKIGRLKMVPFEAWLICGTFYIERRLRMRYPYGPLSGSLSRPIFCRCIITR